MLIKTNGRLKDPEHKLAPRLPGPDKVKHLNAIPLTLKTIPTDTDGRRIPSTRELFELMNDPQMRIAVNVVEREYGCETMLKHVIRKQLVNDRLSRIAVDTQKKAIDLAEKKKAGN